MSSLAVFMYIFVSIRDGRAEKGRIGVEWRWCQGNYPAPARRLYMAGLECMNFALIAVNKNFMGLLY